MSFARLAAILAPIPLLAAGVAIANGRGDVYTYAWTHPSAMLFGQFALLALAAAVSRWTAPKWAALALFWVFSGVTAWPLVMRGASLLDGLWTVVALAAAALVAATSLYVSLRRA